MLIECKSYSGEKTLTNEGCMNVKGRTSYNVFSQSRMHLVNLDKYISRCKLSTANKPYILCMFSYSKDAIEDLRTEDWKSKFRLLTECNMLEYLESLRKEEVLWNTKLLHKVITRLSADSDANRIRHIENMNKCV